MNIIQEIKRIFRSFQHAANGIAYVFTTQRNMKIHFCITVIVLVLSILLQIPRYQLLFVFSSIVLVMCMELMNTAVEKTVDLITDDFHPLAKIAKDVAAGAVLFAAIFAFIIGIYVFLPFTLAFFSIELPFAIENYIVIVILCVLFGFWLKKRKGLVRPHGKKTP